MTQAMPSTTSIIAYIYIIRADSSFAPSQWETALYCNDVSYWLGASLESALYNDKKDNHINLESGGLMMVNKHYSDVTWAIRPLKSNHHQQQHINQSSASGTHCEKNPSAAGEFLATLNGPVIQKAFPCHDVIMDEDDNAVQPQIFCIVCGVYLYSETYPPEYTHAEWFWKTWYVHFLSLISTQAGQGL